MKKKGKIAVAVSGGVDSSVSAYLLQKKGYRVTGVFTTVWTPEHIPCSVTKDRECAMRACAALSIPFMEFDATEVYQARVINPFVETYRRGETPNPDILCNTDIKFDALYKYVQDRGFSHLATGHYARIKEINRKKQLIRSVDEEKDQTYFLYTLPQKVLENVMFPVGAYTKKEVRKIAKQAKLPAAEKKDSTGLCFLGNVSMKEFLAAYIKPRQGEVLLADKQIGEHDGAWFYTLGQRHGFTITDKLSGPYIVTGKDIARNRIFVSRTEQVLKNAGKTEFHLTDTVFRDMPSDTAFARYRHRGEMYPIADIEIIENKRKAIVVLTKPHIIAPGQSIVLYNKDGICLGGGVVQ